MNWSVLWGGLVNYVKKTVTGLGALKGSPAKIKSVTPTYSTLDPDVVIKNQVTLEWDSNNTPSGSPVWHEEQFFVLDNGRGIYNIVEIPEKRTGSQLYYEVTYYDGSTGHFYIPISAAGLKRKIVEELPTPEVADKNTIYMVLDPTQTPVYDENLPDDCNDQVYKQWLATYDEELAKYVWLYLGSTATDLTQYQKKIDEAVIYRTDYPNPDETTKVEHPTAASVPGAVNEFQTMIGSTAKYDYTNNKINTLTTHTKTNLVGAINEIGNLENLKTWDSTTQTPATIVDAVNNLADNATILDNVAGESSELHTAIGGSDYSYTDTVIIPTSWTLSAYYSSKQLVMTGTLDMPDGYVFGSKSCVVELSSFEVTYNTSTTIKIPAARLLKTTVYSYVTCNSDVPRINQVAISPINNNTQLQVAIYIKINNSPISFNKSTLTSVKQRERETNIKMIDGNYISIDKNVMESLYGSSGWYPTKISTRMRGECLTASNIDKVIAKFRWPSIDGVSTFGPIRYKTPTFEIPTSIKMCYSNSGYSKPSFGSTFTLTYDPETETATNASDAIIVYFNVDNEPADAEYKTMKITNADTVYQDYIYIAICTSGTETKDIYFPYVSDYTPVDNLTTEIKDDMIKAKSAIEVSALPSVGQTEVLYHLTTDTTTYRAGIYTYTNNAWELVGGEKVDNATILDKVSGENCTLRTAAGGATNGYKKNVTLTASSWTLSISSNKRFIMMTTTITKPSDFTAPTKLAVVKFPSYEVVYNGETHKIDADEIPASWPTSFIRRRDSYGTYQCTIVETNEGADLLIRVYVRSSTTVTSVTSTTLTSFVLSERYTPYSIDSNFIATDPSLYKVWGPNDGTIPTKLSTTIHGETITSLSKVGNIITTKRLVSPGPATDGWGPFRYKVADFELPTSMKLGLTYNGWSYFVQDANLTYDPDTETATNATEDAWIVYFNVDNDPADSEYKTMKIISSQTSEWDCVYIALACSGTETKDIYYPYIADYTPIDGLTTEVKDGMIRAKSAVEVSTLPSVGQTEVLYRVPVAYTDANKKEIKAGIYIYDTTTHDTATWVDVSGTVPDELTIRSRDIDDSLLAGRGYLRTAVNGYRHITQELKAIEGNYTFKKVEKIDDIMAFTTNNFNMDAGFVAKLSATVSTNNIKITDGTHNAQINFLEYHYSDEGSYDPETGLVERTYWPEKNWENTIYSAIELHGDLNDPTKSYAVFLSADPAITGIEWDLTKTVATSSDLKLYENTIRHITGEFLPIDDDSVTLHQFDDAHDTNYLQSHAIHDVTELPDFTSSDVEVDKRGIYRSSASTTIGETTYPAGIYIYDDNYYEYTPFGSATVDEQTILDKDTSGSKTSLHTAIGGYETVNSYFPASAYANDTEFAIYNEVPLISIGITDIAASFGAGYVDITLDRNGEAPSQNTAEFDSENSWYYGTALIGTTNLTYYIKGEVGGTQCSVEIHSDATAEKPFTLHGYLISFTEEKDSVLHPMKSEFINVDGVSIVNDTTIVGAETGVLEAKSGIEIYEFPENPKTELIYRLVNPYTDPTTGKQYKAGIYVYDQNLAKDTAGWVDITGTSADERTIITRDIDDCLIEGRGLLRTAVNGYRHSTSTIKMIDGAFTAASVELIDGVMIIDSTKFEFDPTKLARDHGSASIGNIKITDGTISAQINELQYFYSDEAGYDEETGDVWRTYYPEKTWNKEYYTYMTVYSNLNDHTQTHVKTFCTDPEIIGKGWGTPLSATSKNLYFYNNEIRHITGEFLPIDGDSVTLHGVTSDYDTNYIEAHCIKDVNTLLDYTQEDVDITERIIYRSAAETTIGTATYPAGLYTYESDGYHMFNQPRISENGGLIITDYDLQVNLATNSGLSLSTDGLAIIGNSSKGISVDDSGVGINLLTSDTSATANVNSGLKFANNYLKVNVGYGLTIPAGKNYIDVVAYDGSILVTAAGIKVQLDNSTTSGGDSGLTISDSGLSVKHNTYYGTTEPDSSTGKDGDIYIQYAE